MPSTAGMFEAFDSDRKIAIAFSGGRDSLALLSLSLSYFHRENITCLYVNHKIRSDEELEREIALNRGNCDSLGVRLVVLAADRGDIERISKMRGCGVEDAARCLRYDLITSWCHENGIGVVLTAHHGEDQIETMIMRLFNGSGPYSLSSIRRNAVINGIVFHRPLLNISRDFLEEHLASTGLVWSEDSTNSCDDYLRNRIRHFILPQIKAVFPDCIANANSLALRMARISESMEKRIGALDIRTSDDYVLLDSEERRLYLDGIWMRYTQRPLGASAFVHVDNLIAEGHDCETSVLDVDITIKENNILFSRKKYPVSFAFRVPERRNVTIALDDDMSLSVSSDESDNTKLLRIADEDLTFPLLARSPQKGDRLDAEGSSVSLKSLMSSWKLDGYSRSKVVVLEDACGIAAVISSHVGGRDRLRKSCKKQLEGKTVRIYSIQ